MATCNDCIHRTVCVILAVPDAFENTKWDKEPCDHFKAADVAPRAEVAREIFEEIRKIGLVTRVIESGNIIYDVTAEYTALQKKYTEEN